jgi:cell division protein FtsN
VKPPDDFPNRPPTATSRRREAPLRSAAPVRLRWDALRHLHRRRSGTGTRGGRGLLSAEGGQSLSCIAGSRETPREAAKDAAKTARGEAGGAEKPRFDFYKILPGVEEPKVQPKTVDRATTDRAGTPDKAVAKVDERPAPPGDKGVKAAERFWLQAGSFGTESDAENLKARLAFAGWEATVQSANLPDKGGIRYRVRLGPYDNTDELNRMKGELAKRGFDVAVIKF